MEAWHDKSGQQVLKELETDPGRGLSREEAARRLVRWGPNQLAAARKE